MSKKTADSDIKVELMYIVYFILAFTLVIMFIGITLELNFTCQIILVKYLPIVYILPALLIYVYLVV